MIEKEVYEGEIEHQVCCYEPRDKEFLSATQIKESDLKKYDLKEGDKIRYTIDKDDYVAVVVGKIEKKNIPMKIKN